MDIANPVPKPPPGTMPLVYLNKAKAPTRITATQQTKQILQQLGWQEGEPIPAELGDAFREFGQGKELPVLANLSADQLQQLRQLLVDAKQVFAASQQAEGREEEINKRVENVRPELQEAAKVAVQAELEHSGPTSSVLDTSNMFTPATAPITTAIPTSSPTVTPVQPPDADVAEIDEEEEAPADTGAGDKLRQCPRCSFDLSRKLDIVPTEEQRDRFVAMTLGIVDRFNEQYTILNGQGILVFRSLTSSESDLIFEQLSYDMRAGEVTTQAEYLLQMQKYRLLCSLAEMSDKTGQSVRRNPVFGDWPDPGPPKEGSKPRTKLVPFLAWFNDHILPSESARHVAGQHLIDFQRLVETMEAQVREPDFWPGIGQQA